MDGLKFWAELKEHADRGAAAVDGTVLDPGRRAPFSIAGTTFRSVDDFLTHVQELFSLDGDARWTLFLAPFVRQAYRAMLSQQEMGSELARTYDGQWLCRRGRDAAGRAFGMGVMEALADLREWLINGMLPEWECNWRSFLNMPLLRMPVSTLTTVPVVRDCLVPYLELQVLAIHEGVFPDLSHVTLGEIASQEFPGTDEMLDGLFGMVKHKCVSRSWFTWAGAKLRGEVASSDHPTRGDLRKIFVETLQFMKDRESSGLLDAPKCATVSTPENDPYVRPEQDRYAEIATVVMSRARSFEAARPYAEAGKRVMVLDFANATTPGGGVLSGCRAQEESLCRCSTLYAGLTTEDVIGQYYDKHREGMDPLGSEDCIFVPGVTVMREDHGRFPMLPESDWYRVDVVACAAPKLTEGVYDNMELYKAHLARARRILMLAARNREEVLILGAFGCGAFRNPPAIVARAWKDALQEFSHQFRTVEFAVAGLSGDDANYRAFENEFRR